MILLGRGIISWDDDDKLLKRFFTIANSEDATHVIGFVGRSLRNEKNELPIEVINRFKDFWDRFFTYIKTRPNDSVKIIKPFGWWFITGRFETEWALSQLSSILEISHGIDPDTMVVEHLSLIAKTYTMNVITILKSLAKEDKNGWGIMRWSDHAKEIIKTGLANDATKSMTTDFIHELGALGHVQFRELLAT
jgi:hypothetical protein